MLTSKYRQLSGFISSTEEWVEGTSEVGGLVSPAQIAAAVGVLGQPIDINFDTPVCVRPGEFIDIIARNIGTVTTTGAITFLTSIGGYWE